MFPGFALSQGETGRSEVCDGFYLGKKPFSQKVEAGFLLSRSPDLVLKVPVIHKIT